jgi:hypothetical protein
VPQDFRLAPTIGVRFVGAAFVSIAAVVFVLTFVAAAATIPFFWVLGLAALAVLAAVGLGVALRRVPAVRMDDDGYAVHWLRGVGVRRAGWTDVEEANTASQGGVDCVVIGLSGGRTTTIPMPALAVPRDEFVTVLRDRLKQARPTRPLGSADPGASPDSASSEDDR